MQMPRLVHRNPAYRKHRASGQAVVTIDGKFHYLGPHGSRASRIQYDRLIAEWLRISDNEARESEPVKPVGKAFIEAVLPFLSEHVRTMVRLELLTGMRPGEVCTICGRDLDTAGKVWLYTPVQHKNRHRGMKRIIYLGPLAQELVKPFLKPDLSAPLFSPAESEAVRRQAAHEARTTPRGS